MHDLHPDGGGRWGQWSVVVVVPNARRLLSERVSWGDGWGLRRTREPRGRQRLRVHRPQRGEKRVRVTPRDRIIRWAAHRVKDVYDDERDMQLVVVWK